MRRFNAQAISALVILVCLSAVGCSDTNHEKPAASAQTKFDNTTQASIVLEDGVYPVVLGDEGIPKRDPEIKVVELINAPVEASEDATPEKIRVIPRPLLRFGNLSHFDFTFAKNQCTEIGFQNTDELKVYTRDHVGSRLAVVVDNKVISHHKIREAIEADEVRITCCTAGGGDHLHKHLKELKLASNAKR